MNIFFDVDHTMIGEDNTLRPGVKITLRALHRDRHVLFAWSGDSLRTSTIEEHDLGEYFSGVFRKPTSNYLEMARALGVDVEFVVDDYPQAVRVFGGVCVGPYFGKAQHDGVAPPIEPLVLDAVAAHLRGGRRNHERELWFYSYGANGLRTRRFVDNVLVDDSEGLSTQLRLRQRSLKDGD
jgi:hypothetical protein